MKNFWIVLVFFPLLFACSKISVYPEAPFSGDAVRITVKSLPEQKPVFFTFHNGKKGINYFVVRLNNSVESYFDACAKCNPKKLGFRVDKGLVVCRACNEQYAVGDLKDGIGSCYPIKLKGRIEGDLYVIERRDILLGDNLF